MSNSNLFNQQSLPAFNDIRQDEVVLKLKTLLDDCKEVRKKLLQNNTTPTFDTLFLPLDDMDDAIHRLFSPIAHLHSVVEDDTLRKIYNESLPLLTAYQTDVAQDEALYAAVQKIAQSVDFKAAPAVQKRIVDHALRDFRLSGVMLSEDDKKQFATLLQELNQLATTFSEHILDATQAYYFHTDSSDELDGLPTQSLQLAKEEAARRQLSGYVLTLDYPCYSAAMKYLTNRALRETLYYAYSTRASERGPHAGKHDNSDVIVSILKARYALSKLLGYSNYATYSLATKMAKDEEDVLSFLHDLLKKSHPIAKKEFDQLSAFAKNKDQIDTLCAWDIAYYSEALQLATFELDQEKLRPYFPVDKVLAGLFKLVEILYGINITPNDTVPTWHQDARFFEIADDTGKCFAGFYIDLYARPHKRDGAWMDDCMSRRKLQNGDMEHAVAYLTCNFMRGVNGLPALLTHDDVITLFHEFGHCLHHLLTKVDYLSVSGIHGVPWDAVEFPSQFMENFCWDQTILTFLSGHYETNEPLPLELYEKLLQTKHFQVGMQMVRQLEFALFDFTLHMKGDIQSHDDVAASLAATRAKTAVYQVPDYNRFQHSFSHIFAGGYAAGYYSYLWANVLAADAFELFETKGLLNETLGRSFRDAVLAVGGSIEPLDAFKQFRGRAPSVDALLRQSGILTERVTTKV